MGGFRVWTPARSAARVRPQPVRPGVRRPAPLRFAISGRVGFNLRVTSVYRFSRPLIARLLGGIMAAAGVLLVLLAVAVAVLVANEWAGGSVLTW